MENVFDALGVTAVAGFLASITFLQYVVLLSLIYTFFMLMGWCIRTYASFLNLMDLQRSRKALDEQWKEIIVYEKELKAMENEIIKRFQEGTYEEEWTPKRPTLN